MAVGSQSIKRAAAKAAEEEKTVTAESAQAAEEEKTVAAESAQVEKPEAAKKTTTKTAAKKTATKTKAAAKKTSGVKTAVIPSVSPEVAEGMRLTGKERYQVNDELPTYLL